MLRNMTEAPTRNPKLVLPRGDAPCPCGSGRGFAGCCDPHLPGSAIGKAAEAARTRRDPNACLVALRADLAQWSIWHQTNTVPRMAAGLVAIGLLVETDIENMSVTAERVAELMEVTGEGAQVGAMLERLRNHVDDPRWGRRLTFLHALHAWKCSDRAQAERELAKLGPILPTETDPDILRLAVGLSGRNGTFARFLQLCSRMIELSDRLEDQLRHRGMKAALYIEHGDRTQARAELEAAVALAPEADDRQVDWEEGLALSWCLTHLGFLAGSADAFGRAERLLDFMLTWPSLDAPGQARLFKARADLFRYARQPAKAEPDYRRVLELEENAPARIYLADALLLQGEARAADEVLRVVEPLRLDPSAFEDYLFVSVAVATHLVDRPALRLAAQRLRASRGSAPYFEQQRLALLVAVEDALRNPGDKGLLAKVQRLIGDRAQLFNRYVMLEPNINGFGFRLNNLIEDLAKGRPPSKPPPGA